MIKCGWCQSENCKEVGREWSGHAIYACSEPTCGHEWVETSVKAGPSAFFDNFERLVKEASDEMKKEKKKPRS